MLLGEAERDSMSVLRYFPTWISIYARDGID
jgi:hypothetical protein